jgi:hypothetical protein
LLGVFERIVWAFLEFPAFFHICPEKGQDTLPVGAREFGFVFGRFAIYTNFSICFPATWTEFKPN